jgi:hypothetical protein
MFVSATKYLDICEKYPYDCVLCGETIEVGDVYMYYEGLTFCQGCLEAEKDPDYLEYLDYLEFLKRIGIFELVD